MSFVVIPGLIGPMLGPIAGLIVGYFQENTKPHCKPQVRVKVSSFPRLSLTYIYSPERTPVGSGSIYHSRRWR
jgi:hypothetical protein